MSQKHPAYYEGAKAGERAYATGEEGARDACPHEQYSEEWFAWNTGFDRAYNLACAEDHVDQLEPDEFNEVVGPGDEDEDE